MGRIPETAELRDLGQRIGRIPQKDLDSCDPQLQKIVRKGQAGESPEALVKIRTKFESDKLYSFKQLQEWIKQDLSTARTSKEKSEIMKDWWERICNTYSQFAELMEPEKLNIKLFGVDFGVKIKTLKALKIKATPLLI